ILKKKNKSFSVIYVQRSQSMIHAQKKACGDGRGSDCSGITQSGRAGKPQDRGVVAFGGKPSVADGLQLSRCVIQAESTVPQFQKKKREISCLSISLLASGIGAAAQKKLNLVTASKLEHNSAQELQALYAVV
ncbi:MAG: hypothetical protein Q4F57_00855, partial [Weeksellaceae bacterium]|nr:hypothetical protein [Weeksellaceae bacterium]